MSRVEVRDKLTRVIKDMLLSDLESNREVPESITNHILQSYGLSTEDKPPSSEDLNEFVRNLQKWIEDSHLLIEKPNERINEVEFDFDEIFEKYLQAESEYVETTSELIDTLEEIMKQKEKYSEFFKNKCKNENGNMDVLHEKSEFIKLRLFLKLYGEGNALKSHIKLREKLQKELATLEKSYNEIVELNKQYDEIKKDKKFCELFNIYKDLRRIESYTDIIGEL